MTTSNGGPWGRGGRLPAKLTRREREVLSLLREGGSTNKEMARQLDLCEATIKIHMKGMYRKLSVANRSQAILKVMEIGLGNLGTTKGELTAGLGL